MRRILREPLVHFAFAGALLFAFFGLVNPPESLALNPAESDFQIVVGEVDVARLDAQFEAVWNRAPSPEEREALVGNFVTEEVLVREALALGLGDGDAIIRNRLRQKMEFLLESSAGAAEPDDTLLQDWYADNGTRFAVAPQLSLSQVFLGTNPPAESEVDALVEALAKGQPPAELGVPSLLPNYLPQSPQQVIDGTLGQGVFAKLVGQRPGEWHGPVQSGYGYHLVRIEDVHPGRIPDLAEVRDKAAAAWQVEQTAANKAELIEELRERYEVLRADPGADS